MRVVTFGEIMLRLMPLGGQRRRQSLPGELSATYGGAEANVAVSIALQGGKAAYCTAVPDNIVTDGLVQELRKYGVDTDLLIRTKEGRFGIYFVEPGSNQRGSNVTYDRAGSSISSAPPETYDWMKILDGAGWFHVTGITPAIGSASAAAAIAGAKAARAKGLPVSCDLNYRKKLWNWEPGTAPSALARQVMGELLQSVTVLIANEEDAEQVLGIHAPGSNVEAGTIDLDGYTWTAREIVRQFPHVEKVAITLRESFSANHNNWGALLYDAATDAVHVAPTDEAGKYTPYEMHNIVDRVGAGDSFGGALIFACTTPELSDPQTALRYAVAASCLKHGLYGDFNLCSRGEIETLMQGSGTGRVQR